MYVFCKMSYSVCKPLSFFSGLSLSDYSSALPHIPASTSPSLAELICYRGCPFSILSSTSLPGLIVFLCVFTFASTCLVLFVNGFPSLFVCIIFTQSNDRIPVVAVFVSTGYHSIIETSSQNMN
jgi:hypothetical protein